MAQEQALLEGPLPVRIVRAAQFHEFVEPLVGWTIQDGVAYVPEMRTQLVAARVVAETLADAAEEPEIENGKTTEVAGPREERLADAAAALFASRGDSIEIRESRGGLLAQPGDSDADACGFRSEHDLRSAAAERILNQSVFDDRCIGACEVETHASVLRFHA